MSSFTCDSNSERDVPNAVCTKSMYRSSPMYCPSGNRYSANGPVRSSRARSASLTSRCIASAACFSIARCTRTCPARCIMYGSRKSG